VALGLPFPIKLRVPTKLGFKNPKHFRDMLILGIGGPRLMEQVANI
jgi:hypothetical protein